MTLLDLPMKVDSQLKGQFNNMIGFLSFRSLNGANANLQCRMKKPNSALTASPMEERRRNREIARMISSATILIPFKISISVLIFTLYF